MRGASFDALEPNRTGCAAARRTLSLAALASVLLAKPVAAAGCRPPGGSDRVLRAGSLLMLGEIHGTVQSPDMAARLLCRAIAKRLRIVLFLEMPTTEQPRLDAFLESDGGPAAQHALIVASPYWATADSQDGRRSVAMFRLVDTVRRWRRSGAALTTVAFDDDAADRDAAMARQVRDARRDDPAALLVTYTGNVHNALRIPADWPPDLVQGLPPPMGTQLVDLAPTALNLEAAAGSAWTMTDTPGIHSYVRHDGEPARREALRWTPRAERAGAPYSGTITLPTTTPSIPAIRLLAMTPDLR